MAVDRAVEAVEAIDERTTLEIIAEVIDQLVNLSPEQIARIAPEKRPRLVDALASARRKLLDIPDDVIDALSELREMAAVLREGDGTLKKVAAYYVSEVRRREREAVELEVAEHMPPMIDVTPPDQALATGNRHEGSEHSQG